MMTTLDAMLSRLSDDESHLAKTHLDGRTLNAPIVAVFDARGLACPMPLLKAKVALRQVSDGESLYLIASDKNSQTDLVAFCQKQGLTVDTWQTNDDRHNTENYFHFIITKKASV